MNSSKRKQVVYGLIIFLVLIAPSNSLLGQHLKVNKLTKSDIERNVRSRYEFNDKDNYYNKTLLLYKDGRLLIEYYC